MLRKRRMEKLHVTIHNNSFIYFKTEDQMNTLFQVFNLSEIQKGSEIEYLKIGDTVVKTQKAKDEKECIYFYFEDHFIGIRILSEIICDFFCIPIYSFLVSGAKNINDPRRAINWIMSRQNSIADCSFHCEETSDEDVTYFLDRLRVTKDLSVFVKTSENFQYSFK
uniref:DUF3850 domain-containing protein n=1 Tax=Caenorhabditis tropicalis TaxID=1561998 RepID=A0A1I7UMK7_9PELO